jgi:hypothetical protein
MSVPRMTSSQNRTRALMTLRTCWPKTARLRWTARSTSLVSTFLVLAGLCLPFAVLSGDAQEAAEWTLEQARHCWLPMIRPVQHVGVPGFQFQAGVLWDGALVFGPLDFLQLKVMQAEIAPLGAHRLHLSVGYGPAISLPDRAGRAHPGFRRCLEEGRLPIPHVLFREGDLAWDERVFAFLLGQEMDQGMNPQPTNTMVVQADFMVANAGHAQQTAHLWLHWGDTSQVHFGYKCGQGEELAPAIPHRYQAPFGMLGEQVRYVLPRPDRGLLRWHDELPPPPGAKTPARRVIEWEVPLAPQQQAHLRLLIPYGVVDPIVAQQLLRPDGNAQIEKARRYWRKLEHGPGQILTPDPFVNDYLAAVPGQICQQIAYRPSSDLWMYKTSPNHYEGYWPCNAAKALPALDLRGLSNFTRPVLSGFVAVQTNDVRGMDHGPLGRDEGLKGEGYAKLHGFLGNFGEWTANPLLISHGLGLWALARQLPHHPR